VHEGIVATLIAGAADKLRDARHEARQVPEELGGVKREEIEGALVLTEASLKADVAELRGDLAAAHAFIRRCRFPRDEHRALFGALAELRYALEEIEEAAAAAEYPESETSVRLPLQHLVPRSALASALGALESRLSDFDQKLADIERQQSGRSDYEDQDALIEYVTTFAGAQSVAAHELAAQRQVDIRGLSHVIEGLGRIVAAFVATVAPAVARVTQALKTSAMSLGRSGRDVVAAGGEVTRTAVRGRPSSFAPGDRFKDFEDAPEMIVVAAGEFMMGSRDGDGLERERPQHRVAIKAPFAVGVCPVTRGEFAAFIEATNHKMEGGGYVWDGNRWKHDAARSWHDPGFRQDDDHPAVAISWNDAQAYVAWLRERSGGKPYRLLSEAEWEYCCRAGTTSAYSTGETITPAQANFDENAKGTTSVFKFPANTWALRDMHGNVWEWCEDVWHEDYRGGPPADGSVWRGGDNSARVLRGGSWVLPPRILRSANRSWDGPNRRYINYGFRVAMTLLPHTF
jgi:formylglycine-generating enzyme required for sulfatase activity